jgi:hypothetical protein
VCSGLAWKGVFCLIYIQLMCCALKSTSEGKRGEKESAYSQEGIERGCYESELMFTHDQGCIHSADSVEKCFLK